MRAAAFLAVGLAASPAFAADWTERPYDPPVGSRWTIQRDLDTEETPTGFRFMYARRKSTCLARRGAGRSASRAGSARLS